MQAKSLSDVDAEEIWSEYRRQILAKAAIAQLTAAPEKPRMAAPLKAVPDLPPDPDFLKSLKIIGRYLDEAIRHLPDSGGIVTGIARLIGTPDGRKLIDRLKDALFNRKEDPTLFRDLVQALGGGIAGYASFILGVVSEASGIVGGAGVTGVAIPLKAESKIKWFSGVEVAKGASIKVGTGLIFGQKTEEPTHLTGQFYAGHTGAELGVSLGSTIFFDTADALNFKGFVTTVGIGIGLPVEVSVVRGWELVTSD